MIRRMTACAVMSMAAGAALADNPLVISESLSPTDAISIGFDGPNTPGPSTFYYDLYLISVNADATYTFTMEALSDQLAPWIGVYNNNFTPADYWSPPPIDLAANAIGGTTVSMDLFLSAGTYQILASSVDWIEEPDALDEGPYRVTVSGPPGTDITLLPAPGTAALAAVACTLGMVRRRR